MDDQSYVLVLDEQKDNTYYFKEMEVTTNGSYDGQTALDKSSTFKPGTQFLVKGAFSLIGE
jgi:cobalt-zinc-cadmium efflux system membrane fusion protein